MTSRTPTISSITIINPDWFNDLKHLPRCLAKLDWADERIIISSKDTPKLRKIAKENQAQLFTQKGGGFADWRNLGAQQAHGQWLLYVDADERVPSDLKKEILATISSPEAQAAYAMPRSNKILGKEFRHGGWWPDYVLRLMQKKRLVAWQGDLHEQPEIKGEIGYLKNYILHIKFQKLENYVSKTIDWSTKEAKLYIQAHHPPLTTLRFIRLSIHPFLTSLFSRLIIKGGILDGAEGLIDAIYQSYSQFINFARLWEMQTKPTKN